MGEKEEKKKPKGGEEKPKGGGGGGENKAAAAEGPTPAVLKVDMHCEGCAMKIKRAVKGLPGVEKVSTDMANNKLTVVGNVDPLKIRERLESKTHKKVDLLTPVPKKEASAKSDPEPNKKAKPEKEQKKPEAKLKTAVSSTLVLKIRLHCDGCIQRIRKTILRYKGVDSVTVDSQKDLVTVVGTMDASSLTPYLKDKLKRSVDVVPAKKDDGNAGGSEKKEKGGGGGGGGEKKEKGGGGGGDDDKKEKGGGGGDGEKKEKGKGDGGGDKKKEGGDGEKKKEKEGGKGGGGEKKEAVAIEANKMEYHGTYGYENGYGGYGNGNGNGNGYGYGNGYHLEMVHAPQMFSDENPNACSIM